MMLFELLKLQLGMKWLQFPVFEQLAEGPDPDSVTFRVYPELHLKDTVVLYGYSPFTISLL